MIMSRGLFLNGLNPVCSFHDVTSCMVYLFLALFLYLDLVGLLIAICHSVPLNHYKVALNDYTYMKALPLAAARFMHTTKKQTLLSDT